MQSMAPAPAMIPQIVQTPNGQQIVMQQVFAQPQFQQAPQFAQVHSTFLFEDFMSSYWICYKHIQSQILRIDDAGYEASGIHMGFLKRKLRQNSAFLTSFCVQQDVSYCRKLPRVREGAPGAERRGVTVVGNLQNVYCTHDNL